MRTRLMVFTAAVILCICSALMAASNSSPQPTDYVIRVTSTTPGAEVEFDAAILFRPADTPLRTFRHKTPYELHSTAFAASAMFSAHGKAAIRVELVGMQGDQQRSRSTATGRAIVVGDNMPQGGSGFITSF